MIYISIIGLLSALAIIGLITTLNTNKKIAKDCQFLEDYQSVLARMISKYYESGGGYNIARTLDASDYTWLVKRSLKAQNIVNSIIRHTRVERYSGIINRNYQVVIDTLAQFQDGRINRDSVNTLQHSIFLALGDYEDRLDELENTKRNWIKLVILGATEVVAIPLTTMRLIGIITENREEKIKENKVFKFGSLVGVISGVVTIIQGYDQTINFIEYLIFHLPF
jgi:hypothetical protein